MKPTIRTKSKHTHNKTLGVGGAARNIRPVVTQGCAWPSGRTAGTYHMHRPGSMAFLFSLLSSFLYLNQTLSFFQIKHK